MSRRLRLQFHGEGPIAHAELLEKQAPSTTEVLWSALEKPASVEAIHAMFAGPEIMTGLPPSHRTFDPAALPAENQTVIPAAGDILWYYQRPNQIAGLQEELWEIGVFYGSGGRVFGPLGWTPVTIFARITEGLDSFAQACSDMRRRGVRQLTIARSQS